MDFGIYRHYTTLFAPPLHILIGVKTRGEEEDEEEEEEEEGA